MPSLFIYLTLSRLGNEKQERPTAEAAGFGGNYLGMYGLHGSAAMVFGVL